MDVRFALSVLLVVMVITATSCGDDGNDEPPPTPPPTANTPAPEPKPRGVKLDIDRPEASPGDTLELTVVNHTRSRLEYGVAYRLERWTGERWRWINRDSAFILLLMVAEPGKREREEIPLPDDLVPGRYRIVKSFTARPGDRELSASVEFRVG